MSSTATLITGGICPLLRVGCTFEVLPGKKLAVTMPERNCVLILGYEKVRLARNGGHLVPIGGLTNEAEAAMSQLTLAPTLHASVFAGGPELGETSRSMLSIKITADYGAFDLALVLDIRTIMYAFQSDLDAMRQRPSPS